MFLAVATTAGSTIAIAVRTPVGVLIIERVAVLAMSLGCVRGCDRRSSHDVFARRNWLKMVRAYAAANAAQMIDLQSLGDWADEQLICGTRCPHLRSVGHMELGVSVDIVRPFP